MIRMIKDEVRVAWNHEFLNGGRNENDIGLVRDVGKTVSDMLLCVEQLNIDENVLYKTALLANAKKLREQAKALVRQVEERGGKMRRMEAERKDESLRERRSDT